MSTGSFHTENLGSSSAADARRVVLVGRTPAEDVLQRTPGVKVIRVATVLEAIGEISLPEDGVGPGGSVVVLGRAAQGEAPGDELADAIRLADPEARIVRVTGPDRANGHARSDDHGALRWWDAEFDEREPRAALHAVLGTRENDAEPEAYAVVKPASRPPKPAPEPRPARARPAPPTSFGLDDDEQRQDDTDDEAPLIATTSGLGIEPRPARGEPDLERVGGAWVIGDRSLVTAVIRGQDPLPMALELLRERVGRRDIDFLPADPRDEDDEPRTGVPVVWEGHPLGTLIASDADRATLAKLSPHASWLAGWLRLSRQSRGLRKAAFTDPLTGAWNRRYFDKYLDSAMSRAREDRLSLTVLMFDIDGFKQYNDRFGHAAGDEILIEMVRVLRSVIRPSDRVCRIGGDEFAVVFFEPMGPRNPSSRPPESVYVLTKRVQQKIREREFPKLGREAAGRLTISGGLATYPWDGADAESLLGRADELAIQSKRAGKNAITFGPSAERICGPEPEGA